MGAGAHQFSNPSAARLAAVHDSTMRIVSVRILVAVLFIGWMAMCGWWLSDIAGAISGALSSAASNIKITVQ
jgi:hypothetical protein